MKQFGAFHLDTREQCLWRDGAAVQMKPKPFDVLCYLVENAGHLVTHHELLSALWPQTYVQPQVLRTYILELRKILGDDKDDPRYLETVPRRGYRFIAAVTETAGPSAPCQSSPGIAGRERELEQLETHFKAANRGERRIVFVSGDAGIGKTTLLDEFLKQATTTSNTRVARGQCIEGYAGKEPYYPAMEALAQLGSNERTRTSLEKIAPLWLAQSLFRLKDQGRSEAVNAAHEHMLHEGCEAFEKLSFGDALILILEDVHWADPATLDLVSALARRRASAKLLLLATYRPTGGAGAGNHARKLKHDLLTHKLAAEIELHPLGKSAVAEYLRKELKQAELPAGLASLVHQYSGGNPLFMTLTFEHLVAQKVLVAQDHSWSLQGPLTELEIGVPDRILEMIETQIEGLTTEDQRLLEAGSLVGIAFPSWAAAAALLQDQDAIEESYERLARQLHFLHPAGTDELPDGSRSRFYVFAHTLYREALLSRQLPSRRARHHQRIGERLEQLFDGRAADVAFELATHFESACDWRKTSQYLQLAAESAIRRQAFDEAASILNKCREMLQHLPLHDRKTHEAELAHRFATFSIKSSVA